MEVDQPAVSDIGAPDHIVANNEDVSSANEVHSVITQPNVRPEHGVQKPDEVQNDLTPSNSNSQDHCTTRKEDDDDDGSLCPICLDNWTNSGEQRICSLKCGHVFCHKCVVRWLNSQQHKSCPTCKKRANKSDIRFIYAKRLIAVDNSELEALKQQLNSVVAERNNLQLDLSNYMCREGILNQRITQLENRIHELIKKDTVNDGCKVRTNETASNSSHVKLYMDKSLEICRQNGCRVFDSSKVLDLIMVSAKSSNNLFSGFGIKKLNISQYKPLAFIPLHQQQIRDISFHPANNWLLTASMDKSFKVTDTNTSKINFTSSQDMPLWSCCWDMNNHHMLYVGTQAGTLVKYDVRSLDEPVCTLSIPGDMSPVVSVSSIPSVPGSELPQGGIVCCKLNSLSIFENHGEDFIKHPLSLIGPFVSMKYDCETRQLLVSSRPNNLMSHSRHVLCTLGRHSGGAINAEIIHTFLGGGMQKLLSKSCFVHDKQEYVAAYEESNKCVFLWSINTGHKTFSIPANDAVLDLGAVQTNNGNFLVALTERKINFFKFNS